MRTTPALFWLTISLLTCPLRGRAETLPEDLGSGRPGVDWTDFLGPGRSCKSPETGLDSDWSEPPPLVWQLELGTGYAAPAVSRGRLLHFDRHGDQARLTCRNSETGKEVWRYEHGTQYTDMVGFNNGPRCSPVIDGNRVYTLGAEGELHCLSLADGKPLWRVDTDAKFNVVNNFFGVGSTPLVIGDVLVVNVGGSPPDGPTDIYAVQGNVDGNGTGVVGFDKLSGEVRWRATDELASYASPVQSTFDGRPWCFILARGGLIGLDPRSGDVDFQFPWRARLLESVNASSPVVVGSRVFISEAYGPGSALLEVRAGAPKVVWQDEARSRDKSLELHWNTAIHHEGYLYGSSGQHAGTAELRCVALDTGEVAWRVPGLGRASLVAVDGHLICLSEDGTLRLLEATAERYTLVGELTLRDEAGKPLLEYPAWTAPVLSHGLLYVRGKGRLVCLEVIPPVE